MACCYLKKSTHARLPVTNRRKAGMTSNHHAPYDLGYTRTTMASTEGSDPAKGSETEKGLASTEGSDPAKGSETEKGRPSSD